MCPSHTAEKWGSGVGSGVQLALCGPGSAWEVELGDLNTHMQPGHCTQRCLKGEKKVREGRKGCTGWPGTQDTPPSTLRQELWESASSTSMRQLGPAAEPLEDHSSPMLPQSSIPKKGSAGSPGSSPGARGPWQEPS